MATPLACAAANACLDIFEQEDVLAKIEHIEAQMQRELQPLIDFEKVVDVRIKGAIGVVELDCNWDDIWKIRRLCIEQNVWLRPFGNILYMTPPFSMTSAQLSTLTQAVHTVLKNWHG